ncbi:contact-dependent growth inhibition system immunity protein [Paludisphaera soli]|uniref:contact-dependent growth inhibition system immunity protein n=1 Tax=Paludisphaera soli TaxID=2712865 RepID=UPI0013EB18B4|nr:contact-dependent growth inhibition system immunity protein [Paludisphaera soli]
MRGGFDRSKTLQEIERRDWGEPTYDSYLVTTCHRLRRKPLDKFTAEDLRIMIGQKISLPILMPLAVEWLEREPLAAGRFYGGDLLAAVTAVGDDFWAIHPDSLQRVRRVLGRVQDLLPSLDEVDQGTINQVLEEAPRMLKAE